MDRGKVVPNPKEETKNDDAQVGRGARGGRTVSDELAREQS